MLPKLAKRLGELEEEIETSLERLMIMPDEVAIITDDTEFEKVDPNEPPERAALRKARHERNRQRIEAALEEKRARETAARDRGVGVDAQTLAARQTETSDLRKQVASALDEERKRVAKRAKELASVEGELAKLATKEQADVATLRGRLQALIEEQLEKLDRSGAATPVAPFTAP